MRYIACLYLLLISLATQGADLTRFIVLDVGEGQSLLVQKDNYAMMIDTGHAGEIASVLKRLQQYGVNTIETLVLTHLHPDHASGFFRLHESFENLIIYHNCQPLADHVQPDMVRWVRDALKKNKNAGCIQAGDVLDFDEIKVSVLWPLRLDNNNLNQNSLVLSIEFQGASILVMGDAGFAAEQHLLDKKIITGKMDLLVVGHHGAKDASSEAFISKLKPEYSVVSVNKSNVRGYPSLEVIQRLNKYSGHLLRTDEQGDLVFMLNDEGKIVYQN
ncbi:MAG: ComEC/Rec2 family competence protein [Gammaproteobacteria bacterium]